MSAGDDAAEAYEAAACGLLTTQADGTIVRVNRTFCAVMGRPAEELIGRRFQDLLTVGSKLFHQTHWMPLLQMQGSVAEVQMDLVHADGRQLPVLVNAALRGISMPLDSAPQAPIDVAVFVAADRRKYERELMMARRQAEQLLDSERMAQDARARAQTALHQALRSQEAEAQQRAQLAEQLIGIVSHDLRNPLNAITLGAHILKTADLGSHARTAARIASSSERANRLIADLLDFTQARLGGGLRVERRPTDLHQVAADCADEVRVASPGRAIALRPVGEGKVSVDPHRMGQVIANLLSNAIAYGDPERPVELTTLVAADTAAVRVHNHGRPIPPELLPRVFEPMRRGDEELTSAARSVGLGLYIVRAIAEAHGGEVDVSSSAADGTTFSVVLPHVVA
jgi:sigma-B regulation protein RsbU (phosphoserine phosphatase)